MSLYTILIKKHYTLTQSLLLDPISLLSWFRCLIASLISLLIHSLPFVVALTLPMFALAASIIASVRNLFLKSNEASAIEDGAASTEASTSLVKPAKLALLQFHRSSEVGDLRVVTGQSTVTTIGRWSEPMHSAVLHSTLSNQSLWTMVTSGALRPPVPAFMRVADPSFIMLKL